MKKQKKFEIFVAARRGAVGEGTVKVKALYLVCGWRRRGRAGKRRGRRRDLPIQLTVCCVTGSSF